MCGVIVVDVESFRSTNLPRDAYILIVALDIVIIIWSSNNCPTVICLPAVCYFSREATSEIYDPRVYYLSYFLSNLLFATFIFRSIIPKTQKYLAALFICIFYSCFVEIYLSKLPQNYLSFTVEGLTTPLTRRIASICSLCAGTVYIVLIGSPTGLIPWFHNWGKYLP